MPQSRLLEGRILGTTPLTICQMAHSIGVMSSGSADCTHGECRLEECTWCRSNPRVRPQAPNKVHDAIRRDVSRVSKKPHPSDVNWVASKGAGVGVNISPVISSDRNTRAEEIQYIRQLVLLILPVPGHLGWPACVPPPPPGLPSSPHRPTRSRPL